MYNPVFAALSQAIATLVVSAVFIPHFSHRKPLSLPIDFIRFLHVGQGGFLSCSIGAKAVILIFSRLIVKRLIGDKGLRTAPYASIVSPIMRFLAIFLRFPVGSYAAQSTSPVLSLMEKSTWRRGIILGFCET